MLACGSAPGLPLSAQLRVPFVSRDSVCDKKFEHCISTELRIGSAGVREPERLDKRRNPSIGAGPKSPSVSGLKPRMIMHHWGCGWWEQQLCCSADGAPPMTKSAKNNALAEIAADAPQPRSTKTSAVIALLQRAEGATQGEIVETTGWQKHTARAALTGLKKKGHTVERTKADGVSRYRIISAAAQ
jgi:hypothetical protein